MGPSWSKVSEARARSGRWSVRRPVRRRDGARHRRRDTGLHEPRAGSRRAGDDGQRPLLVRPAAPGALHRETALPERASRRGPHGGDGGGEESSGRWPRPGRHDPDRPAPVPRPGGPPDRSRHGRASRLDRGSAPPAPEEDPRGAGHRHAGALQPGDGRPDRPGEESRGRCDAGRGDGEERGGAGEPRGRGVEEGLGIPRRRLQGLRSRGGGGRRGSTTS